MPPRRLLPWNRRRRPWEAARLSDLLARYPWMKEELVRLRPNFKMLNTPLARIMIPKATVAMMSERGEIALDELIQAMKKMIAARAG